MAALTTNNILQLLIGLGLLNVNVWPVRQNRSTAYRGGASASLREEFAAYGLPPAAFYVVGLLKITAGLILLAGLVWPMPVRTTAIVVAVLMVGAILVHRRIKDPVRKSLPAAVTLAMSLVLAFRT